MVGVPVCWIHEGLRIDRSSRCALMILWGIYMRHGVQLNVDTDQWLPSSCTALKG
jgi:hypothetical protein